MNPDKTVDRIKAKFNVRVDRRRLKETYSQRLVIFHNGGMFKLTPELFAMLSIFQDENLILQDGYDNPIQVEREKLLVEAKQRYQEVMNDWMIDFANKSQK